MFVDVSENFGFVQNLLTMLPVHLALYHKKSNPAQKFAKTPLTNQNPARILRFVNSKGAVGNDPTAPFYIFRKGTTGDAYSKQCPRAFRQHGIQ